MWLTRAEPWITSLGEDRTRRDGAHASSQSHPVAALTSTPEPDLTSPAEHAMPDENELYDKAVRPFVDALAALEVDAEPVLRFAPLPPADTRDTEDSDATR